MDSVSETKKKKKKSFTDIYLHKLTYTYIYFHINVLTKAGRFVLGIVLYLQYL